MNDHPTPPRYPPSEVKQWLTCPEFWRLSKRWEPRVAPWMPHISVGTAIHAAIASFLQEVGGLVPCSPPDHAAVGLQVLETRYEAQDTWSLGGLSALVQKGYHRLQQLLESDILPGATVVAVEFADPQQDERLGTERLHRVVDCILARGDHLEVWDWKSKIRLADAYLGETQRAVLHNWQLLDYSWHVQQWFGKPVSHAAHGLVVLGPKLMAQAIPIPITPERLTQWHRDAERIWAIMWAQQRALDLEQEHDWDESGHCPALYGDPCRCQDRSAVGVPLWHNWEACTDRHLHYGKECTFLPACHELCGNESTFSGLYQRKENA